MEVLSREYCAGFVSTTRSKPRLDTRVLAVPVWSRLYREWPSIPVWANGDDSAPQCWRAGMPPRPVQPPSSGSAKRRSWRKIPERFCSVSETACLVVNGPREIPNGHPRVSTREFQRSLLTRTAAPPQSILLTKWYLTAVHRDKSLWRDTRI